MNYFKLASVTTLLAGFSHITLQAYTHMGMHFYFIGFLVVGFMQILLGIALWQEKMSESLFWLLTLVNGTSIVFWLLTRTMSAPFMVGVEHISVLGIAVVLFEAIAIVSVAFARKDIVSFVLVVLLSSLFGFSFHVGAMSLEHYFPEMRGTGTHGHFMDGSMDDMHEAMMKNQVIDIPEDEEHDHADCTDGQCPAPQEGDDDHHDDDTH